MTQARSLHDLRPDAFHYAWDNSFEPALEIESGEAVLLHVRDASDEQIRRLGRRRRPELDSRTSTRSAGPMFVKGAQPGDTLAVELLEFARRAGAGRRSSRASACWRTSSPSRGCGSRRSTPEHGPHPLLRAGHASLPAVSGHARGRAAGAGRALDPSPVAIRGQPGHEAPEPRNDPLPPRRRRGALFSLGDTHAAQGDGEVCGTAIETAMDVVVRLTCARTFVSTRPSSTSPPAHRPARAVELPRLHRRRARPAGGGARSGARHDHVPRRPPASTGRRPTRSRASRPTCGSTRSSTRRTGWWTLRARLDLRRRKSDCATPAGTGPRSRSRGRGASSDVASRRQPKL